ncbi:Frizzled-7-B,Frizzled-2,Frizzled-7,Frizzled-7-A,Frizzled-1 [Mytilus coruscus]|uniref:Frizzled-7-B,Frizzled-2,Frizzled-7,Frizzled-7-A,F rizzled-1 n=1 Tax=Mytilus coruscus TaxID=42192 RepID=A0A6J8DR17_MYTCO|nr:Frizzled-7-B,Frizzled-2,Frizzled-7,Frizzled-7-A,Frizzled-1 [Mytilus coruscus]
MMLLKQVSYLLVSITCLVVKLDAANNCEKITVPLCTDGIGYNFTKLPNSLGHETQRESSMEVHQFFPLVKVKCSQFLKQFLCEVYAPKCNPANPLLSHLPSRQLCEKARDGCAPLLRKLGFYWPESLRCENFSNESEATKTLKKPPTVRPVIKPSTVRPIISKSQTVRPVIKSSTVKNIVKTSVPFKLSIRYTTSAITFVSCCNVYTYAKKDFALPVDEGVLLKTADVRSLNKPTVSWETTSTEQIENYFTLLMVTEHTNGSYDGVNEHRYINWMVTNIRDREVSSGVTLKEYEGSLPLENTNTDVDLLHSHQNTLVYFQLYNHPDPLDIFSFENLWVLMEKRSFTEFIVASKSMTIEADEYARFKWVQESANSESSVCKNIKGYPENCREKSTPVTILRK